MAFKLIRVDSAESLKIHLPVGKHVIGRGNFLVDSISDKRVSRNHAELEVTGDTVTLKSLHQNPCFCIKKNTDETQILKENNTMILCNGDKFGILPETYWYEVIHYILDETNDIATDKLQNNVDTNSESTEIIGDGADAANITDCDLSEKLEDSQSSISLLTSNHLQESNQGQSPTVLDAQPSSASDQTLKTVKRLHSVENAEDASKRVKTEPPDDVVKQELLDAVVTDEARAGPSNDQGSTANDNVKDNNRPLSPAKQSQLRERCMYGANCYSEPSRSTSRRVTYNQLEILWKELDKRRDIALGYNKTTQAREFSCRMWKEVARALNSQGDGAVKDWKGWCKYWNDYKYKLKKLAGVTHQYSQQTGGGPSTTKPLSDIEKKFLHILGDNYSLGLPETRVEPFAEEIQIESPISESIAERGSDSTLNNLYLATSLTEPGPSWSVTPLHHPTLPIHLPSIQSPVPPTPSPIAQTPPPTRPVKDHQAASRRSARCRRHRREPLVPAEVARRALDRESQRRTEIDERNSAMFRELVDEVKQIKHILQRRNPQHKAQFSHPSDSDWGNGDRGVCPYGKDCRKRDPRHWLHNQHPPGVQPPSNAPPGKNKRNKPVKRKTNSSDSEEELTGNIVTGKRARKALTRVTWSGSESENEDPYATDESDEWQPTSDFTETQDY